MKLSNIALSALALSVLFVGNAPSYAGQFAKNHPRRAEVLGRDRNLNRRANADKGHLGGHYNQIKREDSSIRNQEQRDARINGGYITKGQQHQLNKEENKVNRQIERDHN